MGRRVQSCPRSDRGAEHSAARPPAGRAGVTLLELLLVMAVLGIVVGGGLGLFAALDVGKRQAIGLVKNVLRTAQNSALARTAPARVRIDAEAGTLVAESQAVVGTWRFERDLGGAFGLDGGAEGCEYVDDGHVGRALAFDGRQGAVARFPVQHDPAFDFRQGFSVRLALRIDGSAGGRLLDIGRSVGLLVNAAGAVRGEFTPEVIEGGRARPGGKVVVESPPGVVAPERWARIELSYDRARLSILIDGVPVAETAEDAPVWKVEGEMTISDERRPLHGSVDDLVIAAVVADEVAELPPTVRFATGTPTVVRFDAGGGLDRRTHRQPVVIVLEYDDGTRESVAVGVYGTVEG